MWNSIATFPNEINLFVAVCFLFIWTVTARKGKQKHEEAKSVAEGTDSIIWLSQFSSQSLKLVCTSDKSSKL